MSLDTFLEPHFRASRESETLLINQMSLAMEAQNRTIYKFGFGQSPFPVPGNVVQAMADAASRKEYMAVQGDLNLRSVIAGFHNQMESRVWQPGNIVIGSGSKILLYCVMASFIRAEVLLPAPSWVSYGPQADLAGHQTHWIHTSFDNKWKISGYDIHQVCQHLDKDTPKILVLNYPSNPTGQTYSDAELKELAVALKEHKVLVIADEIYGFLTFSGNPANLERYYPEGVLTTSGLSKWCGAGGWRMGYVHIPAELPELKKRIIGVASETYSCAAAPIQVGAVAAYKDRQQVQSFLDKQIAILKKVADECADTLGEAGVKVHPSEGGFYLFLDFSAFTESLKARDIHTSEALMNTLMSETGVALLPGTAFGMPPESLTARLAYVDFDGSAALEKVYYDHLLAHTRDGISALTLWLGNLN